MIQLAIVTELRARIAAMTSNTTACSPTSTRCALPSEKLDRDAKTCIRFKDVTVLRQSNYGHLRRHTQTRVVVGTERRTERETIGTSESTSTYGWSWSQERGHAASSAFLPRLQPRSHSKTPSSLSPFKVKRIQQ